MPAWLRYEGGLTPTRCLPNWLTHSRDPGPLLLLRAGADKHGGAAAQLGHLAHALPGGRAEVSRAARPRPAKPR